MPQLVLRLKQQLQHLYAIERELGGGGMARVFVARDQTLGRPVVIKVLPASVAPDANATTGGDARFYERFQREIYLAASLQHPHIVPLLTAGRTDDGLLYYTMPFIEGESLRDRLSREGELPVGDAVRIIRNVADALTYAHARGIVHRDVKPENILLSGAHALVTDFGIAKALADAGWQQPPDEDEEEDDASDHLAGEAHELPVGTPGYMAPEQVAGDPAVDHRADLYALGALAYEMLAGHAPFEGTTPAVVLAAQASERPRAVADQRPTVPAALSELIQACLERRPADRPQHASAIMRELDSLVVRSSGERGPVAWRTSGEPAYGVSQASGHDRRTPAGPIARAITRVPGLRSRRGRQTTAAALVLCALVGGGAYSAGAPRMAILGLGTPDADTNALRLDERGAGGVPVVDPRVAAAGEVALSPSIAVLPFVNMSAERRDEYFSDGMTEEITNALAQVDGLRVAARTSAFAFKGKPTDVREIGQQLGVGTVLEGSVRRSGSRLRITAQLVNVSTGYQVWSRSYERDTRDVFAVQNELAQAIRGALRVRLAEGAATDAPLVRQATASFDAYDLYLKGRYVWNERTERGLRQSIAYFEQALAKDSTYALAYAGLADSWALLPDYADVKTSDAYPRARAAALKALTLDSTLAGAHASLALVRTYADWDWAGAERDYVAALTLNPSYATARAWYANYLLTVGRLPAAERELRRAAALDPLSRVIATNLGQTLYLERRYDDAVEQLQRTLVLDRSFTYALNVLAQTYVQQGNEAAAMRALEQCIALDGRATLHLMALGYLHARMGRPDDARKIIAELTATRRTQYVAPSIFATIYSGLAATDASAKDEAFRWLDLALDDHESAVTYLAGDPVFDPLRGDKRFAALRGRMGLR